MPNTNSKPHSRYCVDVNIHDTTFKLSLFNEIMRHSIRATLKVTLTDVCGATFCEAVFVGSLISVSVRKKKNRFQWSME